MKSILICMTFLILFMHQSMAQQKKNTILSGKAVAPSNQAKPLNLGATKESRKYTLTTTSAHNAYAEPKAPMQVNDPVINLLNAKANESPYTIDHSSLISVPAGTYGFANGKISFYQVGATSTGTSTGSGAVGTGSSPGGIGSVSPFIGVNGKSPYTGTGPYGTRLRQEKAIPDSTRRH